MSTAQAQQPTAAAGAISRAASKPLARIDAINIGLMAAAAVLACLVPLELFAVSYVVLGPLHYLTQLAWLRDRHWFVPGRSDPWVLAIPAIALLLAHQLNAFMPGDWQPGMVLAALSIAGVCVAAPQWRLRVLLLALSLAIVWAVRSTPSALLLAVMLPTVLHIFVFTGGFMFTGALRSRSAVGVAAFAAFLVIPAVLLFAPLPHVPHAVAPIFGDAVAPFADLRGRLGSLLGLPSSQVVGVDRFLGWAYSYHYLNWFSKTQLIGWHRGSRGRLTVIGLAWLACLTLYAVDYTAGFLIVGFVGMLHVVLELPLDLRTFATLPSAFARAVRPIARS